MPDEINNDRRSSPSTEIKIVEAKAGLYFRIAFGLFFMLAGAALFVWALVFMDGGDNACAENPMEHWLMALGGILSVGGGLCLPSVFDTAKPVITFIYDKIPFIPKRATDSQPEVKDEQNR